MVKQRTEVMQLQIGKNGLTEAFIKQIGRIFENEKIVKVSILKSACRDKKEAKDICEKIVNQLGKNYAYKLVGYVATIIKFRKDIR